MKCLSLTGIRRSSLKIGWINIVALALLVSKAEADSSLISVPLQRLSGPTNASGLVTVTLRPAASSMIILASNLAPERICTVLVGGVTQGSFVPRRNGRGQLTFTQPAASNAPALNFDPRGKQVAILQKGAVVLRARISGPGEPAGSIVNEQVTLPRVAGGGGGRAEANYLLTNGTRRFSVTLSNVLDGAWTLYVDGIRRRNFTVSGGSASFAFDNAASTPPRPLNFDPRGLVLDLARGTTLAFSGEFATRANGINVAKPSLVTRFIPGTGVTTSGFARVRRWIERDARREVDVELVDVPASDYSLFVDQVFRGIISVVAATNGTSSGKLQFASQPDDEDEQLLNFNPFNGFYSIEGGGTSLFQGQPVANPALDTNAPALMPVRLELPLFNLGVDNNATAHVQFKSDANGSRHFEVSVQNVATGDYSLTVNGLTFARFTVVNTPTGTRGLIEFEDEPEPGEYLLGFDPLGTTIGIDRGSSHYFQRALPATLTP